MDKLEKHDGFDPVIEMSLKRVTLLQILFLGLSVVLGLVAFILQQQLDGAVWSRIIGLLVMSTLYLIFGYQLRRGKSWAYRRVRLISLIGAVGIVLLVTMPGPFPTWIRVEQSLQGLVLLAVAWILTRPHIRARFAKQPKAVN
ncbi:hypothetical protein ACFQZT_11120 [Paenibacillus sp. GCM10027628]|uniref:hypothetical protein n=1 Tax=Paenibacillus sp. GCM10027628 TaxID=3273413 RepID=UPI00363251FA